MQALADAKIHFDYCVVGEPSSSQTLGDMIRVGRRGSLNAHLLIRGKSGHVAYPDTLINPIHQAMPAINALACKQWDQGNDFFPPTTFQVSNFNAGVGVQNVVPGDAQVEFNFRYSSASTQADLIGQTEAILAAHGLDFEIKWSLSGEPFLTEKGRLIDAAVATLRPSLAKRSSYPLAGAPLMDDLSRPTALNLLNWDSLMKPFIRSTNAFASRILRSSQPFTQTC